MIHLLTEHINLKMSKSVTGTHHNVPNTKLQKSLFNQSNRSGNCTL